MEIREPERGLKYHQAKSTILSIENENLRQANDALLKKVHELTEALAAARAAANQTST